MVYLYAAMGVVMMTGIMAVFEMFVADRSIDLKPDDPYQQNLQAKQLESAINRC